MKRARRHLVWDHFEIKNNEAHCKHCNAVYTYNTTTTPMMHHLNNVHRTLVNESSSSSQPTITSVHGGAAMHSGQYLCIPATSLPSEQVLPAAGLTVTRLCEHVDMLIFLNNNRNKSECDLVDISVLQPLKLLSLLTGPEFLLFLFNVLKQLQTQRFIFSLPLDVRKVIVGEEEQRERSSSLDQEDPEPPHIKEEQEELWTSQEGEQLQGLGEADITKFTFTPVPVTIGDDEEKPQSSKLHQRKTELIETEADGQDCGGSEPARNSHPDRLLQPDTDDKTSDCSEADTDDSDEWKETSEPQSSQLHQSQTEQMKTEADGEDVQMLRAVVDQRLTAAAEEIFVLFERSIAEYEEELSRSKEENERQRKLLDAVFNPQLQLHRAVFPADVQQLFGSKEEAPPEQQEWNSSLDQEDPEPPHIKEEQEELWTSQEGEQLQGLQEADITKFTFTPVPVTSEDVEEKPQSSQLQQRQTEENKDSVG
eukprot:superscaffoldBa00003645_g17388